MPRNPSFPKLMPTALLCFLLPFACGKPPVAPGPGRSSSTSPSGVSSSSDMATGASPTSSGTLSTGGGASTAGGNNASSLESAGTFIATGLTMSGLGANPLPVKLSRGAGYVSKGDLPATSVAIVGEVAGGKLADFTCSPQGECSSVLTPDASYTAASFEVGYKVSDGKTISNEGKLVFTRDGVQPMAGATPGASPAPGQTPTAGSTPAPGNVGPVTCAPAAPAAGAATYEIRYRNIGELLPVIKSISPEVSLVCRGGAPTANAPVTYRFATNTCGFTFPPFEGNQITIEKIRTFAFESGNVPRNNLRTCDIQIEAVSGNTVQAARYQVILRWSFTN